MELRVTFDPEADAAYINLVDIGPGEAVTTVAGEDEAAGINLDSDTDGRLLGIEIESASYRLRASAIEQAERIG